MNKQPRIPDVETRAREVAQLRELVKRMDANILDLDELIGRLEADIRNSPLTAYRLGKAKRIITQNNSES
jgi:hypothetical protein